MSVIRELCHLSGQQTACGLNFFLDQPHRGNGLLQRPLTDAKGHRADIRPPVIKGRHGLLEAVPLPTYSTGGGNDHILKMMRKGVTKQAQIEAGIKAMAAGIEINEFYMPGMGGREYARESALDTADVMNQVNPDFIRIRSMALAENLEMYEDYEKGILTRPNDMETIGEIRLFLENLHGITSWVDSDHILNILLELKGRLPEDKDRMLALIDFFLDLPEDTQNLFRLGRRLGIMGQLSDLHNEVLVDKVKQTMDQAHVDKTNIDAVCDRLMIRAIPI